MYSDDKRIVHLLSLMKQFGVRTVVVSPGSRHFPLVHSLEGDDYFTMYSVVDERSAAFFALGLIQRLGEPVAVTCTSGTSVINYASAVVEAFYQQLPLVVLTADRLPELLGQREEQVFRQHDAFDGFIRYQGQLDEIRTPLQEWYCNRIINEAFLELDYLGRGPVHLNIPIEAHNRDRFQTAELPAVRKISRIGADADPAVWAGMAAQLERAKVMIIWGQANPMDAALRASVDQFAERFDCVILADKLSNCDHPAAISSSYMALRSVPAAKRKDLAPDIVISLFGNQSFNGEIKGFLRAAGKPFEVWDIGTQKVSDPYRRLTRIVATSVPYFFRTMAGDGEATGSGQYAAQWRAIEATIREPEVDHGEIHAISALLSQLPKHAVLQIGNSLPIRMTQLFATDPSVICFCNRGVNGIDGCMSTAVGYAAASDRPVFLVVGDLTFFYDMNALWNRHLSPNLRILMLNNEGGGVMHMPLAEHFQPGLPRHVSAGHVTTAEGWAGSLGIGYTAARNREECDRAIAHLIDPDEQGPIMVEVFSRKEEDVAALRAYFAQASQAMETGWKQMVPPKVRGMLKRVKQRGFLRR